MNNQKVQICNGYTQAQQYNILYDHLNSMLTMDPYPCIDSPYLEKIYIGIKYQTELMRKSLEVVHTDQNFTALKSLFQFYMDTLFNMQAWYLELVNEIKE